MAVETRGGIPWVRRIAVDATGTVGTAGEPGYKIPQVTKFVQISNEGASALRIYFHQEDFVADEHYIELPATTGYYEGPDEIARIWLRGVGGATTAVLKVNVRR